MVHRCNLSTLLLHVTIALALITTAVVSRQPKGDSVGSGGSAVRKVGGGRHRGNKLHGGIDRGNDWDVDREKDLSLWIDEQQVKILSGKYK